MGFMRFMRVHACRVQGSRFNERRTPNAERRRPTAGARNLKPEA